MSRSSEYVPLESSVMLRRQDEDDALRLLIAQRRLYRKAKRILGVRWLGMIVIGLGAPVLSVAQPSLAVVAGAVAGLWIFLGRTVLVFWQTSIGAQAAAVQEQFDFYVYGMNESVERSELPSLEEIARIAGPDETLRASAKREKLFEWYPIEASTPGVTTVAISQRANASYADHLLRSTARVWGVATVLWLVAMTFVSVVTDLSLLQFIAGVFLPVLPAFLDVIQYVVGIWRASRDRKDLADSIQARLEGHGDPIEPQDLVVWQERIYALRRTTPEVPDWVYRLRRKDNEAAMHSAAKQLANKADKTAT